MDSNLRKRLVVFAEMLAHRVALTEQWVSAEAVATPARRSRAVIVITVLIGVALLVASSNGSVVRAQTSGLAGEPACRTLTIAATGGAMPRDPATLVLRWLGTASHEIAFRDTVILLDAYYDRPPGAVPLGFTAEDIQRADVIFIGHGHSDHMADAPRVAARTGATVVGDPLTVEQARTMGLPEKQARAVKGGEVLTFKGFTVEAILAHHSVRAPEFLKRVQGAVRDMREAAYGPPTETDKQYAARIATKGVRDSRVTTEGTIAYLFTFDTGFRLLFLDSGGPITEGERKVMQRVGRTDVALVAYQGHYVPARQIEVTLPLVRLFNPAVFLPTHHDAGTAGQVDMAGYPLFMAIRNILPETKSISPMYRSPVCINTRTREVFVGQ